MNSGEEIAILSEMFPDISYDGQNYYYQDKGSELQDKFEELSDYGQKMWLIDLAVLQLDGIEIHEIHDTVYEALYNADLAKRLGFRKLFIQHLLGGDSSQYDEFSEEFYYEMQELNRFHYLDMTIVYMNMMERRGRQFYGVYPNEYGNLCSALFDRVRNLRLQKEVHLVAECRALLYSYDDFILGLKMNQELYNYQERRFNEQLAKLNAAYAEKIRQLDILAKVHGIPLESVPEPIMIEDAYDLGEVNELLSPILQKREKGQD